MEWLIIIMELYTCVVICLYKNWCSVVVLKYILELTCDINKEYHFKHGVSFL